MPPPIPITPQVVRGGGEEREGERQREKQKGKKYNKLKDLLFLKKQHA